jgi:hypothetical protein
MTNGRVKIAHIVHLEKKANLQLHSLSHAVEDKLNGLNRDSKKTKK